MCQHVWICVCLCLWCVYVCAHACSMYVCKHAWVQVTHMYVKYLYTKWQKAPKARTTIWSKLSQSSLTTKDTKTGIVILFHWTEQKRQVVQGEKAFSIQFTHCYLFPLAAWWLGQPEDLHWPVAILSNWILKSGTRKTNPRRRVIIEHMYQANYWTVTFDPLLNYRKLRKEIVKLFLMCN